MEEHSITTKTKKIPDINYLTLLKWAFFLSYSFLPHFRNRYHGTLLYIWPSLFIIFSICIFFSYYIILAYFRSKMIGFLTTFLFLSIIFQFFPDIAFNNPALGTIISVLLNFISFEIAFWDFTKLIEKKWFRIASNIVIIFVLLIVFVTNYLSTMHNIHIFTSGTIVTIADIPANFLTLIGILLYLLTKEFQRLKPFGQKSSIVN